MKATNAIIFLQCTFKAFYGAIQNRFKDYIPRGIKSLEDALEDIRVRIMSDRKKRVSKEEKKYLKFYFKIYNRFGNPNKDFETQQKELEKAITSN